jgi:hypothetical protein
MQTHKWIVENEKAPGLCATAGSFRLCVSVCLPNRTVGTGGLGGVRLALCGEIRGGAEKATP